MMKVRKKKMSPSNGCLKRFSLELKPRDQILMLLMRRLLSWQRPRMRLHSWRLQLILDGSELMWLLSLRSSRTQSPSGSTDTLASSLITLTSKSRISMSSSQVSRQESELPQKVLEPMKTRNFLWRLWPISVMSNKSKIGPFNRLSQWKRPYSFSKNISWRWILTYWYILRTPRLLVEVSQDALGRVKEKILPFQTKEASNIKDRLRKFEIKVGEFRLDFQNECPYNV